MELLSQFLKQSFDLTVIAVAAATGLVFVASSKASRSLKRAGRTIKR